LNENLENCNYKVYTDGFKISGITRFEVCILSNQKIPVGKVEGKGKFVLIEDVIKKRFVPILSRIRAANME